MQQIENVVFLGSKQLGLNVVKQLYKLAPKQLHAVITIDDRHDSRSCYTEFLEFCHENDLPCYVATSRAHSEELLEQLQPQICFVVCWYWLISSKALDLVEHGFLGIHNSLLPKYRGVSPLVWAIISGEQEAGFSLFSFREGMDDGPIWHQETVSIEEKDTIADVLGKIEAKIYSAIDECYLPILRGEVEPREQDHSQATYCAARNPEDGLIDWCWPAQSVYDFVRAQTLPYPCAFTFLGDQKVHLVEVELFSSSYCGSPGQVAQIDGDSVYIVCGDNRAVIVREIMLLGQQAVPSSVFFSLKMRLSS